MNSYFYLNPLVPSPQFTQNLSLSEQTRLLIQQPWLACLQLLIIVSSKRVDSAIFLDEWLDLVLSEFKKLAFTLFFGRLTWKQGKVKPKQVRDALLFYQS